MDTCLACAKTPNCTEPFKRRHKIKVSLSDLIKPAKMNEINWKAKRPKDSSLNTNNANSLLNTKPLKLKQAIEKMKKEAQNTPNNRLPILKHN